MQNKIKIFILLLFSAFAFTGCSKSYTQEDIDALSKSYDSTISDLKKQNAELLSKIEDLESTPVIPTGMSDQIYSNGVILYNACIDYLAEKISSEECFETIHDFMSDILLSNQSNFSPVDKECFDKMSFCYLTIRNIYKEDFSEYTYDQFILALNKAVPDLGEFLNII